MVAELNAPAGSEPGRDVFLYLKGMPERRAGDLSVKSGGEIVTLEGFVRSRNEKRAAEEAALQVDGVKAVASKIVVRPHAERPDTDIVKDILREFRSNILIPSDKVKVVVSDSIIELEGVVSTRFERMLTEAAVKRVRGVVGIRNNIVVRPV